MAVIAAADVFQAALLRLRRQTAVQARRAWSQLNVDDLDGSYRAVKPRLLGVVSQAQVHAAAAGSTYGAFALAEQGQWVAPRAFVNPAAFGAGFNSAGYALGVDLDSAVVRVKTGLLRGETLRQAQTAGWMTLAGVVRTQIADAGRLSASIDVAARDGVAYVRMVGPDACARCIVLAGRRYRWNQGFRRHPNCYCVHVPTVLNLDAVKAEGLLDDPYEVFGSLDEAAQDRVFGAANAQAIRDGGDIYQVVNSRRGRQGAFTTEGTSRRGYAGGILKPGQRRMTPDTIYRLAPEREDALRALREHGYILPGGQVPGGSLRGNVFGHGNMGRGGARRAAAKAVADATRDGVRDPNVRYTMTAAERRLYDAEQRYLAVLRGENPYFSVAVTNRPDPTGLVRQPAAGTRAPLTPQIAAQVEADYRRWLITGGNIY